MLQKRDRKKQNEVWMRLKVNDAGKLTLSLLKEIEFLGWFIG